MPSMISAAGRALRRVSVLTLLLPAALGAQRQGGTLVGRVLSGDVAVPSATIIVSGGRVVLTRVDGRYRMAVPAGRYEVRAQRIGYTTGRDSITILPGQTATLNFKIERSPAMLDAVTAVGSRGQVRSAIDAPVPVVVLPGTDLRATGRTETARMIESLEPSATIPRSATAEGSDLIHPLSLRGLGPDQVLVLVNGKRRHTSALLNVNRTIGRGSTGVDLNAIPASMIDHVEILRDGATAQYGSDAVAGVVNVVLKQGVHGDAVATLGRSATTFNRDGDGGATYGSPQSASDGRTLQTAIDKGVVFGERGFLHGAFELRDRGFTDRSVNVAPGATYRLGDPQSHDVALFLNGGNLFANGLELYADAGGSRRTMSAAGAFRYTSVAPFPNGYLPIIRPTIDDHAGTLGLRGRVSDWDWDLGTTYGRNHVDYRVENTIDGSGSGTRFDAGAVAYGQSTTTLELRRDFSYFDETRVLAGAELRAEQYRIDAGPVNSQFIVGFPGFSTAQATDDSRHDVAGYLDVESDLSSTLLVGLAGRVENYSDVGSVGAGKLSLRWEPVRKHALRASVERGFRVPSLAQSFFSNVATDPGIGVGSPLPAVSPAGTNPPLSPERNMTYSVGVAAEPTAALSATADLYRVEVKDRIVLLDPVFSTITRMANAVDTRTNGLDLSASYALRTEAAGRLRLGAGLNLNKTSVTRNLLNGATALGTVSTTRIEHGQPQNTILLSADYRRGDLGALLRTRRYGEVSSVYADGSAFSPQTFGARWITDANVSYTLLRKYTLSAGADNLFDVYPGRDAVPLFTGFAGVAPYNAVSPFGFNGRFVYGRLSIYL